MWCSSVQNLPGYVLELSTSVLHYWRMLAIYKAGKVMNIGAKECGFRQIGVIDLSQTGHKTMII